MTVIYIYIYTVRKPRVPCATPEKSVGEINVRVKLTRVRRTTAKVPGIRFIAKIPSATNVRFSKVRGS